ncbi:Transforming acidic coiled-coil-containing protein 3 [Merluccius polli]|uniref:Transforming acidic coiled-coil-containing protein 3 n=1 Tax=Merluccius polli TaxID=89951 RepID=A0AA47MNL7_MERPO|nr:Transforming acidic coiled-coil-containing protein 3 [Merluccius polli]
MTSVPVNDENRGVCPGGKHNTSADDIFAIEQPTGRQSILRQTENLPNKTVPKGGKVCFQTPRRDPVTKRILSPSKSAKMASVNECNKAMESLRLHSSKSPQEGAETVAGQDKGASEMCKLPPHCLFQTDVSSYPDDEMPIKSKGGYQLDFANLDAMDPFQGSNKMVLSPARPVVEDLSISQNKPEPERVLEEAGETATALDETLPFNPSVENSLADVSTDICSTESSVVTVLKNSSLEDEESSTATPDKQPHAAVSLNVTQDDSSAAASSAEDAPLPARGAYSLDFDNIDAIDPFQTGGSKIHNSSALGRQQPENQPEVSPVKKTDPENVVDVPVAVKEAPIEPESKPVATVAPISSDITNAPNSEAVVKPADSPVKGGPVKLEFNFDDGAEVKRKPPPKRFGKRPPTAKASEKKPAPEKQPEPPKEPTIVAAGNDVDVDLPKVAYSFDFDKLDDPNFNPFGTNVKMDNQCGVKSSPAGKVPPAVKEMSQQVENQALTHCVGDDVTNTEAGQILQQEEPMSIPAHDLGLKLEAERRTPEPGDLGQQHECNSLWGSGTLLVENSEEFVPGTTFISNDFDGQMDYLEQFGSTNFKESALRKQSLYLKFDPLLRESPKKTGAPAVHINPPRPSALASRLDAAQMVHHRPEMDNFKLIDATAAPIVEPLVQNPTVLESLVPPTNTEEAIIEVLKYSQKDMDAAVAMVRAEAKEKEEEFTLKYEKLYDDGQEMRKIISEFELTIANILADREKDRTVAQAKLNEAEKEKEQLSMDLNAMEISFSELFKRLEKYKGVLEGYKKNEEILKGCAQEYLARIKKEEQRYQTLKAHAEEKITNTGVMVRLDNVCSLYLNVFLIRANEEIGEVRSKFKAEVSGLQAQLRREQLKSQSLEKNYDQKVKEAEELTNLCDELIAKVQKG